MTLAYVALGSNLGEPRQQVLDALVALAGLPGTRVLQRSPLYRTPPWGVLDQPPFINAVAELETTLSPEALLQHLLAIEQRAGRVRAERNGPRTLDLDLLHVEGAHRDDPPRAAEPALYGPRPRCDRQGRSANHRRGAGLPAGIAPPSAGAAPCREAAAPCGVFSQR